MTKTTAPQHKRHRLLKWLAGIVGTIIVLALALYIWSQVSPWPSSLFIRYEFEQNADKVSQALQKYVPDNLEEIKNEQYRPNDNDAYLDVYYPANTTKVLPTIVWIHGGAWISGSKDEVANYLKILAGKGYTVIGINYSIAPGKQYPVPIVQANAAMDYINRNAARFNVDTKQLLLAGDSAGSQIAAQVATLTTNPVYAQELNITSTLHKEQLRGVILNCGAYDLNLPDYSGPWGGFLHTVLWAYSGKKDFLNDPALKPASVINYVTADFPQAFITAGNTDPLEDQSTELAKKLQGLGVKTDTLFYEANHQPALSHEYQFNLDNADGQNALKQIAEFIDRTTDN